jgi:uncharacterized membrane protein HdeD (DUF308 family)
MSTTPSITADIKRRFTWSIFTGVITALLGLFLIAYPLFTATITAFIFGSVMIVVGIAQFVFALHSHSLGRFVLKVILSVLYFATGIAMVLFPLIGVAALTVLLGAMLLVYAGVATATAFQLRPVEGWGWYFVDGMASALMGVLILAGWPSSAFWAIGTLVGVSVLMGGISRIMIAAKLRSSINSVERGFPRAA